MTNNTDVEKALGQVIVIDVDAAGLQQQPHGIDMAVVAGRYQRRAAIAVGALEVGTGLQGELQDFQAALGTGQQEGF